MVDLLGAANLATAAHPTLRALLVIPHLQQAAALVRALLAVRLLPTLAFTAEDVWAYLESDSFAVFILHVDDLAAGGLVAGVRRRSLAPILALGAEHQPDDRIRALRCQRYVSDTLSPAALARRAVELASPPSRSWEDSGAWRTHTWGPLRLDPSRRLACWHGQAVSLTPMQFRLLVILVQAAGAVVSPVELSRRVWGTDLPHDTERVVAHVRRIRKLLEPDPAHPAFLLTVRGEGFRLADHGLDGTPPPALPPPRLGCAAVHPATASAVSPVR